ncbi:hypothetical protein PC123_g19691 [Phytophthora cactorum]|nr:hypothetical protein PC120_g26235 [Phytophthora cactorum]KAG4044885.1 hypothetical protein PC123_g19691 [Phytophthora cactorum]
MRYQYFLAGRRNKGWKTTLLTSLVNSISQVVTVLLYKNMHIPNEDEAEFADENKTKPAAENAMKQQNDVAHAADSEPVSAATAADDSSTAVTKAEQLRGRSLR